MAAHFTVYDMQYPMVTRNDFRFSDWALVREATGLGSEAFILAHGIGDDEPVDKLVEFGYAAVAFWHGNLGMTRARVCAAIEEWTDATVKFTPDVTSTEADAVPLDVPPDGSTSSEASSTTSAESRNGEDEPSETTAETDGGQPGLLTGAQA